MKVQIAYIVEKLRKGLWVGVSIGFNMGFNENDSAKYS